MDPQSAAPYFDSLVSYVEAGVLSFHMPGHQQGAGAPGEFVDLIGQGALRADITQVQGMDDIHRPFDGCLRAHQLAAQAYGSERCYFLVNGSTCGNQAMLLASLDPGEVVLVPRNAHSSTVGGLLLSEARPVYYQPPFDAEMGVFHVASPDSVLAVMERNPGARALFLTSPSYYGAAADVDALVALARQRDMLVLVDEAWGAHLAFHPRLPRSAVWAGADLVVQSSHKLVCGLSQAAMLHANGQRVDRARLESVLRLLQTTSPSCLLVASLDTARRQLAQEGRALLDQVLGLADQARAGLEAVGATVWARRPGVHDWDDSRLVFRLPGFSGYEVERRLRREHNIQLEMSDSHNLVALITPGHTRQSIDRLLTAVSRLAGQAPEKLPDGRRPHLPELPESRLSLKQAFLARWESVPLSKAAGRICVDTVCPYPPGIPWLLPGEVPSPALIEELQAELAAGVTIQGAYDPQLETVRVVKE
ncbi:MAG: aminotransferase class I/II-fold pyridoxal phosphate-dependent enzyme [Candidatus Eremiobacteraeota bacterium]|nr:aminotransferase class I/II-fold pyridoxal phosphate-dependent enzyme [Candidatus Eremiobacteraeota bacterium]MCW5866753.1 aminotransferase class I/II-fold pyridoxal phosphate-dependent enzyme [Candidatus Eremiobacteraeota bacterium]